MGNINSSQFNKTLKDTLVKYIKLPETKGSYKYVKIASYPINAIKIANAECILITSDEYSGEQSRTGLLSINNRDSGLVRYLELTSGEDTFQVGYAIVGTNIEIWLCLTPYLNGTMMILDNKNVSFIQNPISEDNKPTGFTAVDKGVIYSSINKPTANDIGPITWNQAAGIKSSIAPLIWSKLESFHGGELDWSTFANYNNVPLMWNEVPNLIDSDNIILI